MNRIDLFIGQRVQANLGNGAQQGAIVNLRPVKGIDLVMVQWDRNPPVEYNCGQNPSVMFPHMLEEAVGPNPWEKGVEAAEFAAEMGRP